MWTMTRSRWFGVVSLAAFVLVPSGSRAQGLTGELVGTVRDPQGGVLAGAVVRITSPALFGGERRTVSSDSGHWRFLFLPPGTYALSVELPPRFKTHQRDGIYVGPGSSFDVTVVLPLAGFTNLTTVVASSAVARSSGLAAVFTSSAIDNTPTTRNSMFDYTRMAPGASPTSPTSRTATATSVSFFGSSVNTSGYLIDGTNFTCPCQGVSRAEPMVDVIQEVHIQTLGASVEHGGIQGAIVNVVTKQGGNHLTSHLAYYGQWQELTAQPIVLAVSKGTVETSGYERARYRDFAGTAGGPVRRDHVWFFAGYQYLRDYDSQPGADPAFPRRYEQNKAFGKVTSRLTSSLQLMNSFHYESWVNPTAPTLATPIEATTRMNGSVPSSTFFHLTHSLSTGTVWEARAGRFIHRQRNDPGSGDRTISPRTDSGTGLASGNPATIGGPTFDRLTGKFVLNRFQPAWLGVDHALRFGVELERGQHKGITIIPGGVSYTDHNGQPNQATSREPSITGGRFVTTSFFASDSIALTSRVTLDAGVRFDHSDASSPDLPAIDAEGFETDGVISGKGRLFTWNVFSPRFGLSARLTSDGRMMLRASYGRFNQGVLTGELDAIHPGVTVVTTATYNAATQKYDQNVNPVDPKRNLAIDPEMRTPHTDHYSVALDQDLRWGIRTSAAYIYKTDADAIAWLDVAGQYGEGTHTLTNGVTLPIWSLLTAPADRQFLLTNPNYLSQRYHGLVLAMERRLANTWQASGSYTYSRASGTTVTSNATAAEPQFSTIARGGGNLPFGRDPNDLTNSQGRLGNDRPHVFRTSGLVRLRWPGILVAANFQHYSGRPWAATTTLTISRQGSRTIMVEPRGSRRLSSQSVLDLRIAKTLSLPRGGTVDLLVDALNLLNDTAEEGIQTTDVISPDLGRGTQFMDPRRAMIGIRVNFEK